MKHARLLVLLALFGCGADAPNARLPSTPTAAPTASTTLTQPTPAPATPAIAMTPKQLLEKLFTEPHADPAWFQPAFLKAVPIAKLEELTQHVLAASGKLRAVHETADARTYEITFERGTWDATIALADGKVETLFVRPGTTAAKTLDEAVAPLRGSEPGVISMTTWVSKGAKSTCVSATWNDDKPVSDTTFSLAYSGVLAFLAKSP